LGTYRKARARAGLGLCPCDGFPAGYWLLNAEEEKARLEMPRGGPRPTRRQGRPTAPANCRNCRKRLGRRRADWKKGRHIRRPSRPLWTGVGSSAQRRAFLAISGRRRAYSVARAGMGRTERSSASAIAELPRRGHAPT